MMQSANLELKNARPDNQAHLLVWDRPNNAEVQHLVFYNDGCRVNYRENLLQRVKPTDRFLTLHHYLERELESIKSLCLQVNKSVVLLEGLDYLITYLSIQKDSSLTLFWANLEKTRKLGCLLWILLPSKLVPYSWPSSRQKHVLMNN